METPSNQYKKSIIETGLPQEIKFETNFRNQFEEDLRVSKLDPLGMDRFFSGQFSDLNNCGNVEEIVKIGIHVGNLALENLKETTIDQEFALATTRDLGMIASALTKENIEIYKVKPLHDSLLALSNYTGEV